MPPDCWAVLVWSDLGQIVLWSSLHFVGHSLDLSKLAKYCMSVSPGQSHGRIGSNSASLSPHWWQMKAKLKEQIQPMTFFPRWETICLIASLKKRYPWPEGVEGWTMVPKQCFFGHLRIRFFGLLLRFEIREEGATRIIHACLSFQQCPCIVC